MSTSEPFSDWIDSRNQLTSAATLPTATFGVPVTAISALPLSFYYVFLQIRVTMKRISTKTSLATTSQEANDPLLPAFRTQANFSENVPLALILAGMVELNGGNKTILASVLAVFVVGRIMHGEMGLMVKGAGGIGRPIGFFSTLVTHVGLAVYGAWLVRSSWTT